MKDFLRRSDEGFPCQKEKTKTFSKKKGLPKRRSSMFFFLEDPFSRPPGFSERGFG